MKQVSPTFSKKFENQIYHVEFSTFEWSHDILCVAFAKKICVAQVNFEGEMEFEVIGEFNHDVQCHNIAISGLTSLSVLPKILQFCTAGADFKVRIYKSDLLAENTCQVLNGHSEYINDIAFELENNYLASASDDLTARVWDVNEALCLCVFHLGAPGMSVCWHSEDNAKLMVCEKGGVIRFYNVHTQQPILSLESGLPVSCAHWSPRDSQLVAALQQGELLLWDLTRPSRPVHSKVVHANGGGHMRLSPAGGYAATLDPCALCLRVTQLQNGQAKLSVAVLLPTALTWHYRLPIVCIGDDRELCFWKIATS